MATFARGFWTAKVAIRNEAVAKHERRHNVQTSDGKVNWIMDPTDLRGIPAIGKGVEGAIRYTRPDKLNPPG